MTDKVMSAVSYSGAAVSVISGLTLTEWGIVIGILTALITLVANQVWLIRKDRRETAAQKAADRRAEKLHELEVQRICSRLSMRSNQACSIPPSDQHE
jgi:FtsZ-interacting cell division protein ZipA